jgi:hypothetical protein
VCTCSHFKRKVSLGVAHTQLTDKMLQHWMVNPENLVSRLCKHNQLHHCRTLHDVELNRFLLISCQDGGNDLEAD